MYQQLYNDVAQESSSNARAMESLAFEKFGSGEFAEALRYLDDLWSVLLEDLISPENGLPQELRAKLVSIGIWILKRSAAIRDGAGHDLQAFIEINSSMLAGLKANS
jgi:flagellar biosynthesis activator protein FlaF